MYKILYRPIIIISIVLGMLMMLELFALGSITWRNLNRINSIKQDIAQGHEVEQLTFDVLQTPDKSVKLKTMPSLTKAYLHKKIIHLFTNPQVDEPGKSALLEKIQTLFLAHEQGKAQKPDEIVAVAQQLLNLQRSNEEKLLAQVYDDSRLELNFAVFLPIVVLFPAILFGIIVVQRQILTPLAALEQLLKRLTKGEMLPITETRKESLMQPIFNSYNRLITRLQKLEQEHLTHTKTLEHEVRNATHALLEQSHTLARSERLAAVGELAASTAHELRNPLAGIQIALDNMHRDCDNQDLAERLFLVGNEVKRLTSNLNDLLALSKQPPELAKKINLSQLVRELLILFNYQINENIQLTSIITDDIMAVVPETEFRQALLNLLLNAVQALGKLGGSIKLTVHKTNNTIEITVNDSGKGFPKILLEQGVRPFASYHEHGTGLGLAMVQRFARSLGGQLNLSNDSNGHACAKLIMPIAL